MTRGRTPRELRERMERVAAKPRQPSQSTAKRRTTPKAASQPPDVAVTPASRAPKPRSRLEALVEWGMWEFTVVPARRWEWLRAVIRPGNSHRHGD